MAARVLPNAKGVPILGTLPALIAAGGAQKLHEYVDRRHKQLGPIFKDKIGPVQAIFISKADYMRHIFGAEGRTPRHIIPESWLLFNEVYGQKRGLLFMDGEEWMKFRKLMNGVFLKPDSKILVPAISVVADQLIESWKYDIEIRDLEKSLYKWSLETILSILLGVDAYVNNRKGLETLIASLSGDMHKIFIESANLSLLPAKLAMQWNLPQWRRFVKTAQNTFATATQLMTQIEPTGTTSNGLLAQLLKSGIPKDDLHRVTTDLILAAGDTTAYTTQWLLYLLGKHPEIQQGIYEETSGLSEEKVLDSQIIKGCLRETLRLYPVAPFVTRYLPQSLQLDGYQLEKDALVIMSLYSSGRDAASFPEPSLFKPERWIREGRNYKQVLNPYASLPFAMGARSCIGKKIAETQISITIKKIINRAIVEIKNKSELDIKLQLITAPSTPLIMSLKKRKQEV